MRRLWPALALVATVAALLATGAAADAPVLNLPSSPVTVEATGPQTPVSFSVSATDADDLTGVPTVSCSPASGDSFPVGTTTVNCSATSSGTDPTPGAMTSGSFDVTVVDSTPPQISGASDVSAEATSAAGAVVTFSPTASDAVAGSPPVNCAPSSGSTFPIGTTTVNCSASDGTNTANASFGVTVHDTTAPSFSGVPGAIGAEATSPSGAVVDYTSPTASDLVDGATSVSCSPGSGSTFPLGTTIVNCSSTDAHGNIGSTSFAIDVHDTTLPSVQQPANLDVPATSAGGAVVNYPLPQGSDVAGSVHTDCDPASGSTFPIGTTTVSCLVTDNHGNGVTVTFTITVSAGKAVLKGVPDDRTVEATGPDGAQVNFALPTATDAVNGARPAPCSPVPGSTFKIGKTTVTCAAGGASASFVVTVTDTTPPKLDGVPPNQRKLVNGVARASVPYETPSAADTVAGTVAVSCSPASGASFKLGSTKVTCQAKDAHGNVASASFLVQVLDRTAPPRVPHVEAHLNGKDTMVSWKRWAGGDGVGVQVVRRPGHGKAASAVVYSGSATSFVDTDVKPGVKYEYFVFVVDRAGNHSQPATTFALLPIGPLKTPFDGEEVSDSPLFSWLAAAHADYYNVQVWLIRRKGPPVKIFTAWPSTNRLQLPDSWTYQHKRHRLRRGTFRWYVWPGIGPLADAKYGDLLGAGTFVFAG